MRVTVPIRALFWALLPLGIGGCYTEVDVDGEDQGVFFPSLRASIPLDDRPEATGEVGTPRPRNESRLEFEVTGTSGTDTQTINSGEVINFEGVSIFGPGDVGIDWDLYTASALVSWRWEAARTLRLDGLAGLAGTYVETEVFRNATRARGSSFSLGPQFGFRTNWQPHAIVGLYGQATFYWGVGSDGIVGLGTAELAAKAQVSKQAMFFGGWRWQFYSEDRSGSDLRLDMSGPLLGFGWDF